MEGEDHPLEKKKYIPNFHFGVQTVVGGNMIGDRPSTLSTQTYLRLWQKDLTTKILGSTGHGFQNVLEPSSFYFRMTFQWFFKRLIIAFLNHTFSPKKDPKG